MKNLNNLEIQFYSLNNYFRLVSFDENGYMNIHAVRDTKEEIEILLSQVKIKNMLF